MIHVKRWLAVLLAGALLGAGFMPAVSARAEESLPGISVEGQQFVDEYGRVRILHGINFKNDGREAQWNPPLGRLALLDEAFFVRCREMGLDLLRLGLCWQNIEPEKGQYNEPFLQKVDEVFDLAQQYGMYVFIDMHQDLYSSYSSGNVGNGAPEWACLTDGRWQQPKVLITWAEQYFWGRAVQRSFDHFWNNDPVLGKGLQEHYAEVWQEMARRYGDHPAFFGFDLLNEPYPGTPGGRVFLKLIGKAVIVALFSPAVKRLKFLKNLICKEGNVLDVLTPQVMRQATQAGDKLIREFDLCKYTPFVARLDSALREVTPNGILLMENSYYSNIGIPYSAKAPAGESQVAFAPHAYDFGVDTPAYQFLNTERVEALFAEHYRSQQRLDVPVVVGEWGGRGDGDGYLAHISFLLDLFDSYQWSNTYFAFRDGFFEHPVVDMLRRAYPMAINGTDIRYAYDRQAGTFTLEYTQTQAGGKPTILFLPAEGTVNAPGLTVETKPLADGGVYVYLTGGAGAHRVTVEGL